MTIKNLLLTSALLVCAACSQQTSSEKLVKPLKTVQSWTATARMVGETWQQGTIPDTYAQQTLEKSQQEIAHETKALTAPYALQQSLRQLQQTLQKMTVDVKQQHKAEIATSLQQLSKQQQQLDAFVRAQGEQP